MAKLDRRIGTRWLVMLVAVIGAVIFAGGFFRTKVILGSLYVTGRAGGCTLVETLSADRHLESQLISTAALRAASRLLREDTQRYQLWDTPQGPFWIPRGTDLFYVLAEQNRSLYESGPTRVYKGDVVLDCGANVGTFVHRALRLGAATVIAIEPVPHNVEALRRTFEREIREGRVIVYPKGVWNTPSTLTMWTYANSALDSFILKERWESAAPAKPVELPLTTIDLLVKELSLDRVDFIKMDIEGAERQALEGGKLTITSLRPRMAIATENLPDDYTVIPRLVGDLTSGYRVSAGACTMTPEPSVKREVVFFEPSVR